jgi:hypothetical protein
VTETTLATLGTIGIWLLVASGLLLINQSIASQRAEIQADLERLRRAIEETKALWRPYARALRTLNHPLVLAVFASLRRRRAAR